MVFIGGFMKETYIFEYTNENEFKKLERSIKKYNMLAYKKLYFEYYPSLKNGEFVGEVINNTDKGTEYMLDLPTDPLFKKVHGTIRLYYTVVEKDKAIILDKFEPLDILSEGHVPELTTYKGVMLSKENPEKDMFKINLLNMINK